MKYSKLLLGCLFLIFSIKSYSQNTNTEQYIRVIYLESSGDGNTSPSYSSIGDDSSWHYVAVTKNNLVGNIYLDGELLTSSTFVNHPYIWNSLLLGATQACVSCNPVPNFNGLIDEVRVSNIVRSASEIESQYNNNVPFITDANTLGLFHFDSPDGNAMVNSASSNDGILYGGAQYEEGRYGSALSFDGIDDYTDFNESIPVNNMTVEFWFKSTDDFGTMAMLEYAFNTGINIESFNNCNNLTGTLSNGLIAYYPFCGNANDESSNENNGIVNGAILTNDRFGVEDSAYSFNGSNSFIEISDNESLKGMTEISISAWININDWYLSSGSNYFPILHKSNQVTHGLYSFIIRENGGISHLSTEENGFNYTWNFNEWYHVVTVFSNGINKVYVNGILVLDENTGLFPNSFSSDLPLIIGKDSPGLLEFSNGKIDDIGIWNRALAEGEIADLYNGDVLSTNSIQFPDKFKLYPNPASDNITIDTRGDNSLNGYSIAIINSLGQQLFSTININERLSIDVSSWDSGLYFVQIINELGQTLDTKKVILK